MSEFSVIQSDPHSLMEAAAIGNPEAFNLVYTHYLTPVYRYLVTRVDTKKEAEALTQSVFLKVFQNLPALKGQKEHPHYFLQMARAEVNEYSKKGILPGKPPKQVIEIILPSSSPSLQQSELHTAVRALPDDQQDVLILRFMNELPLTAIAHLLEKNEEEIRLLQAKGLKTVAKKLTTVL